MGEDEGSEGSVRGRDRGVCCRGVVLEAATLLRDRMDLDARGSEVLELERGGFAADMVLNEFTGYGWRSPPRPSAGMLWSASRGRHQMGLKNEWENSKYLDCSRR